MTEKQVLQKLVKADFGLPRAIEIYDYLSCCDEIEVDEQSLDRYIAEHAFSYAALDVLGIDDEDED